MIRPTPHNEAGQLLALIVDNPGELTCAALAQELDPYRPTSSPPPLDHTPGCWRRRQEWHAQVAAEREAHEARVRARVSRHLGRLTEANYLEPATEYRLSPWAALAVAGGATAADLEERVRPSCVRELTVEELAEEAAEWAEVEGVEGEEEPAEAEGVEIAPPDDDLEEVEIPPPEDRSVRARILGAIVAGARRRADLCAVLGRERLCGHDERVIAGLVEDGIVTVPGMRWAGIDAR